MLKHSILCMSDNLFEFRTINVSFKKFIAVLKVIKREECMREKAMPFLQEVIHTRWDWSSHKDSNKYISTGS